MGRLLLLLVSAAIVGGTVLSLSSRGIMTETSRLRGEARADLLARQLAESGQGIALTQVTTEDGFTPPPGLFVSERPYDSGRIQFNHYQETAVAGGGEQATIVTAGVVGEASHTLRSVYEFDPMDFPGPLWLDVPYATASVSRRAEVSGGQPGYEPQIDPAKYDDLGIREFGLTFNRAKAALATVGPAVPDWSQSGGRRLGNLGGVQTADDLYYTVTNAVDTAAGDVVVEGDQTITGTTRASSSPEGIYVVRGDLTITGTMLGDGALVVEGDLRVPGRLDWDGLVVVRSEENHVTVDLGGRVTIDGALVVSQEAYPPGGHIDLTTFRDPEGRWGRAWGRRESGPGALQASSWPLADAFLWYDHTHRFDEPAPGDVDATARVQKLVRLVDRATGDPQEAYTGLRELLNHLGSTDIVVEFDNAAEHGHAVYAIDVDGVGTATAPLNRGFAGTDVGSGTTMRTRPFAARDLRTLTVQPRSLRSLRQLWDGRGSCHGDQWPFCVGEDRNDRANALTVRLRRASGGPPLYEAAIYWHMQEGREAAEYQQELARFRSDVQSGRAPFGTDLTLGPNATVRYQLAPIVRLAEKLNFDGNDVRRLDTSSAHVTAQESRAAEAASPTPGRYRICHLPGQPGQTEQDIRLLTLGLHLLHGDTLGPCPPGA
ncbi:hypothetical protein [Rubrivirga marina]|uniref:Uncharacterized protein n=1 Tax=Rubrivirga marina TaxID=1196024 RepID=A0A271J530_9BACT|nr:hypothetical protein [Rubrivirga marina]PAP78460.1 hypothetical protein BSZ37_19530 [Rubrivirga marina]